MKDYKLETVREDERERSLSEDKPKSRLTPFRIAKTTTLARFAR
jgi:hypothetical protein